MDRFDQRSDEDLLGEREEAGGAFGELYRRHESGVLRFFLARGATGELAADLAAETFAQALASRGRFRPRRGTAEAWLFGIARNVLRRSLRSGRVEDRARRRIGLEPIALDDEAVAAIERLAPDPNHALDLLGQLPGDQRAAVTARVLHGRGYPEIAAELQLSQSTVRKRVSRGLAAIRDGMEDRS